MEQIALAHAQGVITVFQEREGALKEHRQRLDIMTKAIRNRRFHYPLGLMMSLKEQAEDAGLRRRADIHDHAFSIRSKACSKVDASLAEQAQDKELVNKIIEKALALQPAEVAVWQALRLAPLPVDVEEVWQALVLAPLPVDAEEAQTGAALKILCGIIWDNGNTLPTDIPRHKGVALSEKALSEMEGIINKMDLELMKKWEKEIAYHNKVLGLSTIIRNTAKEDYAAVKSCYKALFGQKEGSSTPESKGPSVDAKTLLGRCSDLMSAIDKFTVKTDEASSKYIADAQKEFDALRKRPGGVSLVEALRERLLVESEEGARRARGPAAASPAATDGDPAK